MGCGNLLPCTTALLTGGGSEQDARLDRFGDLFARKAGNCIAMLIVALPSLSRRMLGVWVLDEAPPVTISNVLSVRLMPETGAFTLAGPALASSLVRPSMTRKESVNRLCLAALRTRLRVGKRGIIRLHRANSSVSVPGPVTRMRGHFVFNYTS